MADQPKPTLTQYAKSRTNWYGAAVGMAGAILLAVQANMPGVQPLLGKWYPLAFMGIAVGIVICRRITHDGLEEK